MDLPFADQYFATARERYLIRLKKAVGTTPLTDDPVFKEWRFCNVHREHDKTTEWYARNVRQPIMESTLSASTRNSHANRIVEATVAFRWFNRIETGERIKDLLVQGWDSAVALERLQGVRPVVTGAYIIKGYDGMPKLEGVLRCIDEARAKLPAIVNQWYEPRIFRSKDYVAVRDPEVVQLQEAWVDLQAINYMGGFMAYEVVSDLRWSALRHAIDITTWANAGPGCARGLSRVVDGKLGRFTTSPSSQRQMLDVMRQLLDLSRDPAFWPQDWQPWEMREVEHWSCEFDKYQRVAVDGERMKQRYRPS